MIPAAFDYIRATSLSHALGLLQDDPDSNKLVAGGHSLIPALKLRLAAPERLIQIRQNRLLGIGARVDNDTYIDRQAVTDEVTFARRLSAKYNWPLIDVTRRSIEETAAAIMKLFADRQRQRG